METGDAFETKPGLDTLQYKFHYSCVTFSVIAKYLIPKPSKDRVIKNK